MKRILIIGATSAIAKATAKRWALAKNSFYLLGRNKERLQAMATDLVLRGSQSATFGVLDVNDINQHERVIDEAIKTLGGLDIVLIAHGTLGNQKACEQDFSATLKELHTNALSVMSLLTHLANHFEAQKQGVIAVISSVAGDRGRQSNYVYGSAKGAVSIFLQGLRQRLYPSGVRVITIKPGFVDTPMTESFKKGLLWASPDAIANLIVKAVHSKNKEVYAPSYWGIIMAMVKLIPEQCFKRMKL